jgi:hypothetical protein
MNNAWRRFGAGMLTGLIVGATAAHLWKGASLKRRSEDPQAHHARIMKKFEDRLALTATQRPVIEELIKQRHAELREIHAAMGKRFDDSRQQTRTSIRKELSPAQLKAFASMTAEWDKKRAARRKKGHRHHR